MYEIYQQEKFLSWSIGNSYNMVLTEFEWKFYSNTVDSCRFLAIEMTVWRMITWLFVVWQGIFIFSTMATTSLFVSVSFKPGLMLFFSVHKTRPLIETSVRHLQVSTTHFNKIVNIVCVGFFSSESISSNCSREMTRPGEPLRFTLTGNQPGNATTHTRLVSQSSNGSVEELCCRKALVKQLLLS